jgi:ribosomal protein S27AE
MMVQSACLLPVSRALGNSDLGRPNCPRCGNVLFVAEESLFDLSGRIDHAWSCDDCGNEFVTSIRLWR